MGKKKRKNQPKNHQQNQQQPPPPPTNHSQPPPPPPAPKPQSVKPLPGPPKVHAANPNIRAFTTEEVLKNTVPCDIVVKTEGQEFSAHKTILGAKSEFFKESFAKDPDPHQIVINSINDNIMKWILNFLYTEYLTVDEKNVFEMLEAALILKVRRAADHCFRYLTRHNVLNACVPTFLLAKKYHQMSWMYMAQCYIIKNFDMACNEPEFFEFEYEDFATILQSKDLYVPTETICYLACIGWLKHKREERRKYTDSILELIRFPQLHKKFIAHRVIVEDVVASTEIGRMLVSEALDYHDRNYENRLVVEQ